MKNNIKKAPVKFREDLLYFQHFMLIFVFAQISDYHLKVVICAKYINLNKITKIQDMSLKFNRLLIFVILYSL